MKPKLKHELRTPLNHILGYSEMLLEEGAGVEVGDWHRGLERIHEIGTTLQHGVDELVVPTATEMEHRVHIDTPEEWPGLLEEIRQQAQRLLTIVPKVAVGAAEDLSRISGAADTFSRLLDTITCPPEARSAPGSGPLETEQEDEGEDLESAASTTETPIVLGRVLVVDDDEGNRLMLERRVRRLGHEVLSASNGREALDILGKFPTDLVLLDIQMPILDGQQTLQILHADPGLRRIPVIVLSASRDIQRVARCIELGAEDYLPKPFNPILLRARINASLEKKQLRDREAEYLRRIEEAQRRSEELLHVILPRDVVVELQTTQRVRPRAVPDVAVLFTDLAGFTKWCSGRSPAEVHDELQGLVETFEEIALRHGLEKIKTIGDSFMATAGLLEPVSNPAADAVACGLEMIRAAATHGQGWRLRVGVHAGPVSAGVVGRHKYQYDVWGDTVNTASRMEQAAPPGHVCVEASTWQRISNQYLGTPLGAVPIKGKGEREIHRIDGLRDAPLRSQLTS